MSKENNEKPIVDVAEAFSKTEQYLIQNKKSLSIITTLIIVLVGGFALYKFWYIPGEETKRRPIRSAFFCCYSF